MSNRMHLIQKFVVFKGWQQPKTLQPLFIRIKKNFLNPTPAIKFPRIFQPPVY